MQTSHVESILAALERLSPVRKVGKLWEARCPVPDHEDTHPSFYLYPGGGGKCFSACNRYWSPRELAEQLGIPICAPRPQCAIRLEPHCVMLTSYDAGPVGRRDRFLSRDFPVGVGPVTKLAVAVVAPGP